MRKGWIILGVIALIIILFVAFNSSPNLSPKNLLKSLNSQTNTGINNQQIESGGNQCVQDSDCPGENTCKLQYCGNGKVASRWVEGPRCINGNCYNRIIEYCNAGSRCSEEGELGDIIIEQCVNGECVNQAKTCGVDPEYPEGECTLDTEETCSLDRHICA